MALLVSDKMATSQRSAKPTSMRSPADVLAEQGRAFEEATAGLLLTEIDRDVIVGRVELSLYIVAPRLNGYRYKVCRVEELGLPYPVRLEAWLTASQTRCASEVALTKALEVVLASEKLHEVIAELRERSEAGGWYAPRKGSAKR